MHISRTDISHGLFFCPMHGFLGMIVRVTLSTFYQILINKFTSYNSIQCRVSIIRAGCLYQLNKYDTVSDVVLWIRQCRK